MEHGIVTIDDIRTLIEAKDDETELIMTGICNGQELWDCVDEVTQMSTIHKIENNC
ncbi:cob(I)yrinic acid a,c-diamide adenosyltransferase [Enterobacter sichuanensis]|nr:cob(I)yrinic acid a,c-diamide adenosyltransferase [Enterobacter sichuanensis]